MEKSKIFTIGLGIILYLLSTGISYASFSYFRPLGTISKSSAATNPSGKTGNQPQFPQKKFADLPKTQECPLNGAMYSQPEKDLWSKRRPLGVMIENSSAARPQSGLSFADVIYEAMAEGGITRLMAVFYCQDVGPVGPVRSARTYYLDWISEYGSHPLYAHVGGANTPGPADSLGQIDRYGWAALNDLNQFSVGFPTFWRDYDRLGGTTATEHTVYTSTQKAWDFATTKRNLTNTEQNETTGAQTSWDESFVSWKFKADAPVDKRPQDASAQFNFSGIQASYLDDYLVKWQYDHDSNSYLRFNGGKPHTDLDTKQQILAKNVIVVYMAMSVADDGYSEEGHGQHTLYGDKGSGRAKFLLDGKVTDGTWVKKTRTDRTKFFDNAGAEIKLNRGLTWIEVLPIGQPITTL